MAGLFAVRASNFLRRRQALTRRFLSIGTDQNGASRLEAADDIEGIDALSLLNEEIRQAGRALFREALTQASHATTHAASGIT